MIVKLILGGLDEVKRVERDPDISFLPVGGFILLAFSPILPGMNQRRIGPVVLPLTLLVILSCAESGEKVEIIIAGEVFN